MDSFFYNKKGKMILIDYLFLALLISVCIPGLGYFIDAVSTGNFYSRMVYKASESSNALNTVFRFSKDAICAAFLVIITVQGIKYVSKYVLFIVLFVLYGFILLYNNNMPSLIIAGLREFMFIFASFLYIKCDRVNDNIISKITKIAEFMICLNALAMAVLVVGCISIGQSVAIGAIRFQGIQSSGISSGYFILILFQFISIMFIKFKSFGLNKYIVFVVLSVFSVLCTGTRVAMIGIFISALIVLLKSLNIKRNQKLAIIVLALCIGIPLLYSFSIDLAGRGEIGNSGSARIVFFKKFYMNSNIIIFLMGYGLGYATTAANNLFRDDYDAVLINTMGNGTGESFGAADGAFNSLTTQFGIIGLIFLIIIIIKISITIIYRNSENLSFVLFFIASNIIAMLGTNIFEQPAYAAFLVIELYLLCMKENNSFLKQ